MDKLTKSARAGRWASTQEILLQLVQISTTGEGGHDACIDQLLDTVAQYFRLPLAIISQIEDGRYEVEFVRDVNNAVVVGQVFDLCETYCERVIALEQPIYVDRASDSLFADHPCYRNLGLETYLGVRLFVDGVVYGTLNLTGPEARDKPWSPEEVAVLETAGALVSHRLALRQADRRFSLAVKGASVGLWEWDVRTDAVFWSPRFMELAGITDPDFQPVFDDFADRLHPADVDRVMLAINDHLSQRKPFAIEYRWRHEHGHYVWVQARGQAAWGRGGQALRMAGSLDDITERKNVEMRASDRLRLLEMAGKAAQIGYIEISPEAGLGTASDEVYDILGLDRARFELSFDNLLSCVHRDEASTARVFVEDALESGHLASETFRFVRKSDGDERLVHVWIRAVREADGRNVRTFSVIQDVTVQRADEQKLRHQTVELKRTNVQLERFASVASHDLQEPLRKVSTYGGLLARDYSEVLDARGTKMVTQMVDASQRMQQLIADLLQYSRSSHVALKLEDLSLATLIEEVMADLEMAITDCHATINYPVDAVIKGDRVLMRQLFVNLIGNALKYRDNTRKPVVDIGVQAATNCCRIVVSDNGIGFERKHAGRIFEVFRRLHARDAYPGTGVGLALCQRIVERHGGAIRADGECGVGASFTVELPLEPVDCYSLMTGETG
ncbi:PAS domain-containing protein [Maricaulis maris]|uniref:histidine kinase n=1 Tax=Maricaulis maris TaxID=74318 RepID=A0A495DLV8_9PROT|nr:PAS domain-containing protein [Maricaulis maris]RKR02706.1 PAS domain S-box-containing protein [Maricaulis maris]